MTPQELKDKLIQARATGSPIFLLEDEIRWLHSILTDFGVQMSETKNRTTLDKIDFVYCASIAMKCAKELGLE